MLRRLFSKEIPEEIKIEEKSYPYQRIVKELEKLSDDDIVNIERFIQNLEQRRPMLQKSPKKNQRTKGKKLKANQKMIKKERKLDDEIQEAKQKMINDRIIANEGR